MFGLGLTEILFVLVVALLVFGPKKLPEVSRTLGRTLGDLKRTADDFRREIAISDLEQDPQRERTALRAEDVTGPPPEAVACEDCDCETHEKESSSEDNDPR